MRLAFALSGIPGSDIGSFATLIRVPWDSDVRPFGVACCMNLLVFIPIVIAVVVLIWVFGRRGGSTTNGTGDRRDSTERPELTGTEQHKHRQ